MLLIMFLQMVTTMLKYLSENRNPCNLYDMRNFGRISYNRPPPPPQIYFPTSADYADDYYLRSLSNLTATIQSSIHLNGTDSFGNLPKGEAPFSGVFHLPRLAASIFRGVVHAASWIASTVVDIIVAALMALPAVGTPGAVAWMLQEQGKRDRENLEATSFSYLLAFLWQVPEMLDSRLELAKAHYKKGLDKITKEHDSTAQALLAREKDFEEANYELRVIVKQQGDEIKRREEELAAKQAEALAKVAELEGRLATQEQSAREAAEEAAKERKAAQENIKGLMATISSHSAELTWHRQKAGEQRQAALAGYRPAAPGPFPPAPMGGQYPHGQAQFVPRPTQIPGFPPNRTTGFMGSTPPPGWRGGAGRGGGNEGGRR